MNKTGKLRSMAVICALALLGACAVGPDYEELNPPSPEAWSTTLAVGLKSRSTDVDLLAHWWRTLDDPALNNLVERAIAGNRNLRVALSAVREARASRAVSRSNLFPTVDASGSASTSRGSETAGSSTRNELYALGFDAAWEIDVFGGQRRSIEAATANLEAREADYADVMVSLIAEVALNYVDVRIYQKRLAVARENLKTQEETYHLTRWRAEAGLTSALDAQQAKSNLESTRAQIPAITAALAASLNQLSLLLGESPGGLDSSVTEAAAIPKPPASIAVGLPMEALRRRPDVRAAERDVAAQSARVGVAVAALYPSFSLSGSIGLESLNVNDLLESSSRTDRIAAGIGAPIFNAGALRRNIEVQDALLEGAISTYEQAVLQALGDTENAIANYGAEQEKNEALGAAVDAARLSADYAQQQYLSGLIDFTDVLDAQRSLLSLEDELARSDGALVANAISLYKALGGELPVDRR